MSEQVKRDFNYLRHSNYDNKYHLDIKPFDQVKALSSEYNSDISILLIDDTTGTATTIKTLKKYLENCFTDITTGVIECRWNTKMFNDEYSSFGMNDVDIITPLEYRHFRIFAEEIDYIRNSLIIKEKYSTNEFYSEEYIYDRVDFNEYIEESEILPCNKERLVKVIVNYRTMLLID